MSQNLIDLIVSRAARNQSECLIKERSRCTASSCDPRRSCKGRGDAVLRWCAIARTNASALSVTTLLAIFSISTRGDAHNESDMSMSRRHDMDRWQDTDLDFVSRIAFKRTCAISLRSLAHISTGIVWNISRWSILETYFVRDSIAFQNDGREHARSTCGDVRVCGLM